MGAITGAVIAAAGTAYAANRSANAAEDASRAQQQGANAAIDEQRRQYDLSRQDQAPWLAAGQNALGLQQQFLGGDYSAALNSPDYAARLSQGLKALDRSAAARGGLYSGGHSADLMRFGADVASDGLNTYWNRLAGLSGTGQTAASGLGALGASYASNVGNAHMASGNARASGYLSQGNTWGQFGAGLGGIFNQWYRQNSANNGGGSPWYFGDQPGPG